MKHSTSEPQTMNKNSRKTVENKDDLDSRKNEEQDTKGDDNTHNKKDTKAKHLKQKK